MANGAAARDERVFPLRYWTASPESEGQAASLVELAAMPHTWRQRLTVWPNPEGRVVGLVRALRAGVTAETQRVHERADFYFTSAVGEFERLCACRRVCEALSSRYGVADIRDVIARELFLETHIGFLKAYQTLNGESGVRLPKHARWAERALKFAAMPAESSAAVRAWLRNLEIGALQRSGCHQDALAAHESGLDRLSPNDFKDAYVQTLHDETLAALTTGESAAEKRENERVLAAALDRFLRLFDSLSDRQSAWDRLADLYRRRIAAFSGAEPIGTCIGILQRAVDADPFDFGMQSLDVQFRVALSEQQAQIVRAEQQAAAEGKVLNENGIALRNSLLNGFGDARRYLASPQAASFQLAARTLWARRLWSVLGLHESDNWQEEALTLMEAMGAALLRNDREDPSFVSTLAEEMGSRPALRGLDAAVVATRFLALQGALTQPTPPAHVEVPPLVESCRALPLAEGAPAPGSEDLADWLFSRQGRVTRWSIAAAVCVVVIATVLTGYTRSVESDRQDLFPKVMAAARGNDDQLVVDLAARFLARRPLTGRGQLDRAVEQAYADALVNLFAVNAGESTPALMRAAENYRQLVGQPQEERQ